MPVSRLEAVGGRETCPLLAKRVRLQEETSNTGAGKEGATRKPEKEVQQIEAADAKSTKAATN